MRTGRIVEAYNQAAKAIVNLANAMSHLIIKAFKPLQRDSKKRVSYNAKYHKITDDRRLNIGLMCSSFGSNERCYYSGMDR